jgi:hypothetical protein
MNIPKRKALFFHRKVKSADNIPFLLEVIFICPTVNALDLFLAAFKVFWDRRNSNKNDCCHVFLTCERWGITTETELKASKSDLMHSGESPSARAAL